jgi:arylsulfatase A-like enzyme
VGKSTAPLQITDWMPTFCALADAVPSSNVKWDGTNVWPVLTGTASRSDHLLYWTAPGFRSRAVRDGDWKLIVHGSGDSAKAELFNLAKDPNEATDLARRMPEKVAELQGKLAAIAQADRDAVARD